MKTCILLITVASLLLSSPIAHAVDFSKTLKPAIPPRLKADDLNNSGSKGIGATLGLAGIIVSVLAFSYKEECPDGYTESRQGRCYVYSDVGRSGVIEEAEKEEKVRLERPVMLGVGLASLAVGLFIVERAESNKKLKLQIGPTYSQVQVSF